MWTETTQQQYRRDGLRYASDVSDAEWAQIETLLPVPKRLGRPRTTQMRQVVNAMLYLLTTGCQWRLLPKEFPPFSTVQRFFYRWRDAGLWQTINHFLVMRTREAAGREASPTAGVLDSQSVKTTEAAGPRGYDAGKKIKGRKRHVLTDTNGLLVAAVVHQADIQDRDGAPLVLASARYLYPWLRHVPRLREGRLLPMPPIAALSSTLRSKKSAGGRSRSSSAPMSPRGSSLCRGAGLSSAPLPGSIVTDASPKTLKPLWKALWRGYFSPASSYSCGGLAGYNNQTL
jgi:transposase